ncbi:MAG: hypothetical protein PHR36_01895 [Patescibacteria group bacterium]|nr:hypothetical protein [Patescibacteria group bacterium]
MSRIRKVFTISVMLVTVLAMSVVVAPEVNAAASAGDLIKMSGLSSVYYLGADGKRYVFPNEQTYFSWYSDFSGVVTIPQSELESYSLGANVTMRPGTKLVKITTNPKVYAVEPNGTLKWVPSEAVAVALYGADWAKRVVDVSDAFFTNYTVSATNVSATAYPAGSLVKFGTAADVYYINADGTASKVATEAAFTANRFKWADVITSTLTLPTLGTEIATATKNDTSQGGGAGTGIVAGVVGTGLTVALASDTPAAATVIDDAGSSDTSQAKVEFAKINFTAASDGDVKLTTVKFTRSGISADTDVVNLALYDGNTILMESTSIASNVVSFVKSSGIVTIPKGTTKVLTLRGDIADATSTGVTISYSIAAASNIITDGAAVSGSFPISGNLMTVAQVTDKLGYVTFANVFPAAAATADPGQSDYELWRFSAISSRQDMEIRKLTVTQIGTVASGDLKNYKLKVGGTQIGPTVTDLASDSTVTFDFGATPYKITSGSTKEISLTADIIGGSSRTVKFSLQNGYDMWIYDTNYSVYTKSNQVDSWTAITSNSSTTNTTINSGSVVISIASDSPSGNIALGATNVELAKFNVKASGEKVRISSLTVYYGGTAATTHNDGLDNVKLLLDGTQVGSTQDLAAANTTGAGKSFTFGTSFEIEAGITKVLTIKADVKDDDAGAFTAAETLTIGLDAGSANAKGLVSSTNISTASVASRSLTISSGALSLAENTSIGDANSTNPSGVVGQDNVLIGSFVITAGAGEGVTISQITLTDDVLTTNSTLADVFQNLRLTRADTGAAIGTTIGSLTDTDATTYSFTPSPQISLAKGAQLVVNIYADVLSSPQNLTNLNADTGGIIYPSTVYATGSDTSSSANATMSAGLQAIYISSVGTLTATVDAGTPAAGILVMNSTDNALSKFKLTAGNSEDIEVTKIVFSIISKGADETVDPATDATNRLGNMLNFDLLVNGVAKKTVSSAAITDGSSVNPAWGVTNGFVVYDLTSDPITVKKGSNAVLTIQADVNTNSQSASGSQYEIILDGDYNGAEDTTYSPITAKGKSSGVTVTATNIVAAATNLDSTNPMIIRKTKPTIATAALSTTALTDGTVELYRFTVTADANEDVSIKKIPFDVMLNDASTTNLKVDTFAIYDNASPSVALTGVRFFTADVAGTGAKASLASTAASISSQTYSGTRAVALWGYDTTVTTPNELLISAGTTKTYIVKARVASSAINDSIQMRIGAEDSTALKTSYPILHATQLAVVSGDTAADFLWSDYSNSANHSAVVDVNATGDDDWINGYLVQTIPTAYATVSR